MTFKDYLTRIYELFYTPNKSDLTPEEIVERMEPVPYESLPKDRLPTEFAKTMTLLLSRNKDK